MNSWPNSATLEVADGQTKAKAMPAIKAITICVTRLVRCNQCSNGLKIMGKRQSSEEGARRAAAAGEPALREPGV
ncbi:hypothetical protein D3C87_1935550 [compost metagenome]